jgi:branched-chain amino acid transport system substrate-binding protein
MESRLNRRTFLKGIAATTGAATAGAFVITRPGWSQTRPIKLGIIEPQSGPVKYVGDNNIAGYRFAVERLNAAGGALGRQLELVVADSELKSDVATRRANDLVLRDKVDILVVNTGSHIAKAVSQVAAQHKKVFFSTGTEARELTGEEFFETTFRTCLNTDMHSGQLAVYFARMAARKYTRFYLLNQDYNFGHAVAEGFKKKFAEIKSPEQTIVADEYHPLQRVHDFAPYITKIMASGADAVITGNWGQDLRLLIQHGAALGWKVTVGSYFLNDPVVLQAVGSAAVGHVTADAYLITVDTPENKAFLKAWRARYPDAPIGYRYPDLTIGRCVNAVLWVGDVIKRAGSMDTQQVIKAWEGSTFKAPWGEVEMRACDHQMLTPGYVAEILEPGRIPQDIRYFGNEFPYTGPATHIPRDEMTVPPRETGNVRCA